MSTEVVTVSVEARDVRPGETMIVGRYRETVHAVHMLQDGSVQIVFTGIAHPIVYASLALVIVQVIVQYLC